VGWGERVFFVIIVRGHHKRTKRGKSRAPMAFWVHAVSDGAGGWQLPVPLGVLVLKLWQRWAVAVGFRWMKSGFGLGEKPCWGFESGERSVERVGCMGRWCGVAIVRGVGGRVVRVGAGVGVVRGGLLALREPAECVHACSKWQTSGRYAPVSGTIAYLMPSPRSSRSKTATSSRRG